MVSSPINSCMFKYNVLILLLNSMRNTLKRLYSRGLLKKLESRAAPIQKYNTLGTQIKKHLQQLKVQKRCAYTKSPGKTHLTYPSSYRTFWLRLKEKIP